MPSLNKSVLAAALTVLGSEALSMDEMFSQNKKAIGLVGAGVAATALGSMATKDSRAQTALQPVQSELETTTSGHESALKTCQDAIEQVRNAVNSVNVSVLANKAVAKMNPALRQQQSDLETLNARMWLSTQDTKKAQDARVALTNFAMGVELPLTDAVRQELISDMETKCGPNFATASTNLQNAANTANTTATTWWNGAGLNSLLVASGPPQIYTDVMAAVQRAKQAIATNSATVVSGRAATQKAEAVTKVQDVLPQLQLQVSQLLGVGTKSSAHGTTVITAVVALLAAAALF